MLATVAFAVALLVGCHSAPPLNEPAAQPVKSVPAPAPAATAAPAGTPAAGTTAPPGAAGAAAALTPEPAAIVHPDVPPAARADFDRAVNYMRAGNETEAELGFKQVALQYPQFAAPLVNLALLQRKAGQLELAEATLKTGVSREPGSAVAWTELGVTQRMRGEFKEAAASDEQAIAVDAHYAPAWRNLGVVSDLYLGDPQRALKAFEQYKALTGEEKPVSGWIAELRQRLGMPPVKKPVSDTPASGAGDNPAQAPAAAPPGSPSDQPATPPASPSNAPGGTTPKAGD
jgi:tetratricopeptide (TPR) repeat protein